VCGAQSVSRVSYGEGRGVLTGRWWRRIRHLRRCTAPRDCRRTCRWPRLDRRQSLDVLLYRTPTDICHIVALRHRRRHSSSNWTNPGSQAVSSRVNTTLFL